MSEISLKTGLFWLLILALCFVALPVHRQSDEEVQSLFDDYLLQHQKKYDGDEYAKRLKHFKVCRIYLILVVSVLHLSEFLCFFHEENVVSGHVVTLHVQV
jgi:hypothetical protein